MASKTDAIHVVSGALDETDLRGGTVILRGVIDSASLRHLRVDDYQREALPLASLARIINAIKAGDMPPDIEIGMRGQRFRSRAESYHLDDHCFIIDGQQRVNAALRVLQENPGANVRIGAMIHFGTEVKWERNRFRVLNADRIKVSPNVILRNQREENPGIAGLYGLSTNDKTFALYDKVSWNQNMRRGDLTTALTLLKVAGRLHSHKAAGKSISMRELGGQLERLGDIVGNGVVSANMKAFFEIIDECWGIKLVQYKEMAPHLRGNFLFVLAQMLSDHKDFWRDPDEKMLSMGVDHRRKLAAFPLGDPTINSLTSGSGRARALLYTLLREHMDKGKRSGHLKPRKPINASDDGLEPEEDAAEAA